jgi:hypothetical protein
MLNLDTMGLEKKSCERCDMQFEDGDFLIKKENKYYHCLLSKYVTPLDILTGTFSCAIDIKQGNLGIFYKGSFYDMKKNEEKMRKIERIFTADKLINEKNILYGHSIAGDLSFLDNFEPDL